MKITTQWGEVNVPIHDEDRDMIGLNMDDLYECGRNWTRENDPERISLVGGSPPF